MKLNTPSKHGPNRIDRYIDIHETVINQFKARGDFIGRETLCFRPLPRAFRLTGEIACLGNILISVDKLLAVVDPINKLVQTKWYSYNVSIRGYHNLLRYDNQDKDFSFRPSHKDEHHKHSFNWRTGQEDPESPIWIGADNWLTLGEVIEEVEGWYWRNHSLLPEPDSYPALGARNNSSPPSLEL